MWEIWESYKRVTKVIPTWPAWSSDQCVRIWSQSVQNCRLEDKKTVSSYTHLMRYDHLKKELCHHKAGPPLFSSEVNLVEDWNFAPFSSQTHRFRDMTVLRFCNVLSVGFLWTLTPPYRHAIGRIRKAIAPYLTTQRPFKFQVDYVKTEWEIDAQKTPVE